ncbi:hypothetical protein EJB05_30784 [Eragrostis curvula]|uniref:Uncharacterized protein n=1 Tax=Eragrostis curvula TaxID=38414 RepID=A0A5J9UDB2_9POAL|nr:hypothetical protein EJB05_30784 [Eragrostis curvula]
MEVEYGWEPAALHQRPAPRPKRSSSSATNSDIGDGEAAPVITLLIPKDVIDAASAFKASWIPSSAKRSL